MGDGGKAHLGDVARARKNALAIPDRLARLRKKIGKESAAIRGREDSRITPFISPQRPNVQDVDNENVAGLGAGDLDWPDEMVAGRQIAVTHIGGIVVILDLTGGPIECFDN